MRALEGLERRRYNSPLELVVVDNDEAFSARRVCEEARLRVARLTYLTETRRGIPFARNTAVDYARGRTDLVGFLDDDEVPEADWLDELLAVLEEHAADVVTGPSRPRYPDDAPRWIVDGGFFEPARHATGARLDRAYTNNVLARAGLFETFRFDERMALTGGSDTELFRRIAAAGHAIVWADDAVVHEVVPSSRLTKRWILQRAYRMGSNTVRVERGGRSFLGAAAYAAAAGGYRIAKGLLTWPFAALRGPARSVWSVRHVFYGAGMIMGLAGVRYDEYRRTHGD